MAHARCNVTGSNHEECPSSGGALWSFQLISDVVTADEATRRRSFDASRTRAALRTLRAHGLLHRLHKGRTQVEPTANGAATRRLGTALHLETRRARYVADAMIAAMKTLPERLRGSVTWDQGREMARHQEITLATGMPTYFCDPHSPWQRGSNENTNGLLRQYFPKGTDLSFHGPGVLENVAAELNRRPRKRHGYRTPIEVLTEILSMASIQSGVATTT
ncbi:IS30 family transposase [Pseudoclavibacter sp. Z016]|uniref:IS30 family transposase n=1 Tax=Pseudoclavibacter sp. Z016 TaxID=2080581 RepID=UPI0021580783|nr:IS30 family transposase [Pseudoclavibacter sp. Z016]